MNLVTVATFPTITHLYVIKNQLEEAGIPCVVKDAYTVGTNPFYDVALGGIKLQVREEDAAEAQQMLWQLGYRPPVPVQDNTKQRHPLVRFVLFLLFFVAMLAVIFVRRRLRDPEARYRLDRFLVTAPVIGGLFSRVEMARFARTLGTLLANGVTLVGALAIVRETMANSWLAEAVGSVARELKEGRGLGRPMMETGRFPLLAMHMILVGEETGRLDDMLMQVAETYDREVEVAIARMLALLQPAMIVLMAGVIGFIIFAIMSAMLSVYDLPF